MSIDYESLANIQETIAKITAPFEQFQQQYQKAFEPIQKIQSQYNASVFVQLAQINQQVLVSYQDLWQKVAQIVSSMSKSCDFSSLSAASAAFISSMPSIPYDHADLAENANDYVIIDNSPIKEFEIPNSIAIPIGNNRVRIKTDLFFTILGIIIATTFSLISCLADNSLSSQNEIATQTLEEERQQTELTKKILEEQQQQTELLYKIFDGIDASNSSQKEYLEDIRSVLQAQSPVPQDDEVTPRSALELTDNSLE